ncbi:MAG: hypothetical protein IRZ31_17740 [Thermogemmatispora sp.]|uniref:hypothetical protein n=1 Tax=Thermogemmatispora sp. TaxID=1968838 RepID=UPI0026020DB1|nr:hypothetical protein [Thermogemmatispora sp.]MBX5458738.1 hypothetical protein [Thermogemmatispora sp.]
MSILESIQHGLEKAAQQAARLARIQHLQLVLNDLSYKASLEHRTLSNKVMELYFNGELSQSELLPLCQNLATLEQHIKEIQQELERLHGEGQEQASAPPAAASGPLPAQPSASGAAAPPAAYPAYSPPFPPVAAYPVGGPIAYPPPFATPMPTGPAPSAGYAPPGYVPPLAGTPAVTATPTSDGTTVVAPPPAPASTPTAASGPDPATATVPAGVQQDTVPTTAGAGEPPAPPADVPPLGALPESALDAASSGQPWSTRAARPEEAVRRSAPPGEPGQP